MKDGIFNINSSTRSRIMKKAKQIPKPPPSATGSICKSDSSLQERKKILDGLRRQQNEHLLGVLEEEQEREMIRQGIIRNLMDADEKVVTSLNVVEIVYWAVNISDDDFNIVWNLGRNNWRLGLHLKGFKPVKESWRSPGFMTSNFLQRWKHWASSNFKRAQE